MIRNPVSTGTAPLEHLKFRMGDDWCELPDWARFLLRAGAVSAGTQTDEGRLVIALSVPTRSFAAALAASAAVVTSFLDASENRDPAAHFRYLASQVAGTPVTHRRGNSIEQGTLLGLRKEVANDGQDRLVVRLAKETVLLPEGLCERIQVIADPGELTSRGRTLVKAPEFLARALPSTSIPLLSGTTRADCVIVGVKRVLEAELVTERFAVNDENRAYEGSLQSIVRAREFGRQNDPYRSCVISISADGDEQEFASPPPTVIFDGASAFNNWRSAFRSSNWLVIIDRSSSSAEDGAVAVNQAYAMRSGDAKELNELSVPMGIEMLAYVDRQ